MDTIPRKSTVTQIYLLGLVLSPSKLSELFPSSQQIAKSTDLIIEEDVDTLCGKCDEFALEWQHVADELWANNPHPKTRTQYYRDGGKSKIQ